MTDENIKNEAVGDAPAQSELEKAKAERDEYLNGWKRAKADLINYQKDDARRLEDMARYGNEGIVREVISVIGSFDLALSVLEKAGQADKGLYMVRSQMQDILKRRGVERIKVAVGETLNPVYHEAVAAIPQTENIKSGQIAEEVEPGYTMHGKVIHAAKVKVVS
ncbi:MAG: nucleotide exchange factor GrpE [Candidatus Colwellbacteria bacterium RIFCSPLOWO2_01_FULL_48_10]|uniref:Protein GrpE n=2 Tax=Bacteria candidate phyla TaxID=1783234 RepID=A0A1F5P2Y5_9BACT|nr:MAG: nucleotide exchange factor GrpE [Candidatus Doudnabacteria bacterium RIFCSPHIGHO2_01_FULL_49_9]OGY59291.1 MAG: nucleotide exchange factor GrpE [Candidatus Colwellbacteria bacterium RIFCSPLOWO2_01_FULL_48_10]